MKKCSPITSHVLDTSRGKPAAGVKIFLEYENGGTWQKIGEGATNQDGRIEDLLKDGEILRKGSYRLRFSADVYYQSLGQKTFYPGITITFSVDQPSEHYHVPLLLSPFGYSTYRGS